MDTINWPEIEARTVALNEWLYAEEAGLDAPPAAGNALAAELAAAYAAALRQGGGPGRAYLVESWAEARRVPLDNGLIAARDAALAVPGRASSEGPLTWRTWKAYEREAPDAPALRDAFEAFVGQSAALAQMLAGGLAAQRAAYAGFGLTPAHTFAEREGLPLDALRAVLLETGRGCRDMFQESLAWMSRAVFGREAGPAELRALYLNRMYEPCAPLFGVDGAVPQALAAFARLGFDLSRVPVDVESRPLKYPGAFCFPVHTPGDVRVSVRIASPHHLVDMLYHELGHAVHFAGIDPACSVVDRYWITSGIHETFSTLFESLLSEPLFLEEQFGLAPEAVRLVLAFSRFKDALTATALGAAGLAALDAWLEGLDWPALEARYALHLLAFTGVAFPPGFARLEHFTSHASVYPAGYVLAWARVAHWREHLRGLGGEAWWRSPAAREDIRARVAAGGASMFPAAWTRPDAFLARLRERPIMGRTP